MSVSLRVSLLVVPIVLFGVWGALHKPSPDSQGRWTSPTQDISLDALPSMPGWTGAKLPKFGDIKDTSQKKQAFFSFLFPRIVLANSRILIERQYLDTLARKTALTTQEKNWLEQQAERLRVDEEPGTDALFSKLRSRLDVIPPSLVMAQAANESAWGTSRFAREGNNLFGQWCFSVGCGLVPTNRPEGESYEVAVFASPYRSVRAYIQNLNRHPTYQKLRDVRLEARSQSRFADGYLMAAGLLGYSERGEAYIEEIRDMIRYNNLSSYDEQFKALVIEHGSVNLAQLASSGSASALLPRSKVSTPNNEG